MSKRVYINIDNDEEEQVVMPTKKARLLFEPTKPFDKTNLIITRRGPNLTGSIPVLDGATIFNNPTTYPTSILDGLRLTMSYAFTTDSYGETNPTYLLPPYELVIENYWEGIFACFWQLLLIRASVTPSPANINDVSLAYPAISSFTYDEVIASGCFNFVLNPGKRCYHKDIDVKIKTKKKLNPGDRFVLSWKYDRPFYFGMSWLLPTPNTIDVVPYIISKLQFYRKYF